MLAPFSFQRRQKSPTYVSDSSGLESLNVTPSLSFSDSRSASPVSFRSVRYPTAEGASFTFHPSTSNSSLGSARSVPGRDPVSLYVFEGLAPQHSKAKKRMGKDNHSSKAATKSTTSIASIDSRLSDDSKSNSSGHHNGVSRSRSNSRFKPGLLRKPSRSLSTHREPPPPMPIKPSKMSPTPPMPDPLDAVDNMTEAEIRLRRLHKVTKTLGEQIPAELIFGSANEYYPGFDKPKETTSKSHGQSMKERAVKLGRRASVSLTTFTGFSGYNSDPQPPLPRKAPVTPPATDAPAVQYQLPRPVRIDPARYRNAVLRDSTAMSPTGSTFGSQIAQPDLSSRISSSKDRNNQWGDDTESENTTAPNLSRSRSLTQHSRKDSDSSDYFFVPARPETPFMNAVVPKTSLEVPFADSANAGRRSRDGWSGEWNQNDMGAVISKLRKLK